MKTVELKIGVHGVSAGGYLHKVSKELPGRDLRPCVVVCPGGGYSFVSDRENEPVAFALFSAGYQVFVLSYSTQADAKGLTPLLELSELVSTVRINAAEFHVDPDKVAVMGFSAGGHLAASLGTLWRHESLLRKLPNSASTNQPNALILCYPVITAGEFAHGMSLEYASGGDQELRELLSLENRVSGDTPPTFIWHTCEDTAVPIENSLLFMDSLRKAGVPFEAHLFQKGSHGLSLCTAEVNTQNASAAPWFSLCLAWLADLFDFQP